MTAFWRLDCPLEARGERWVCPLCGRTLLRSQFPDLPAVNCARPPDAAPAAERLGLRLEDVGRYAAALARWSFAGFPTRSPAEVARIWTEICKPCARQQEGRCAACRCAVSDGDLALTNKIKMATEYCLEGRW